MADHRACYFHLRQLKSVVRSLTVVQDFILSRLDYCNFMFYGLIHIQLRRLQSVQNAVARLVTGRRQREHITPVLIDLHWLPVRRRVDFKLVAAIVYKSLRGLAQTHLSQDCRRVSPHTFHRRLRSAELDTCIIAPRTRTRFADPSFAVAVFDHSFGPVYRLPVPAQ